MAPWPRSVVHVRHWQYLLQGGGGTLGPVSWVARYHANDPTGLPGDGEEFLVGSNRVRI